MRLTHHADHRRTQRRLPIPILETIYEFGLAAPCKGAVSVMLDDETIRLAAEDNRARRIQLERYRGVFLVVGDDDRIVTAARRTRRHRR